MRAAPRSRRHARPRDPSDERLESPIGICFELREWRVGRGESGGAARSSRSSRASARQNSAVDAGEHLDETGDRGEPRVVVRPDKGNRRTRTATANRAPDGTRAHATPAPNARISARDRARLVRAGEAST